MRLESLYPSWISLMAYVLVFGTVGLVTMPAQAVDEVTLIQQNPPHYLAQGLEAHQQRKSRLSDPMNTFRYYEMACHRQDLDLFLKILNKESRDVLSSGNYRRGNKLVKIQYIQLPHDVKLVSIQDRGLFRKEFKLKVKLGDQVADGKLFLEEENGEWRVDMMTSIDEFLHGVKIR